MIIFIIFTYFKVPETKGKTFEEIASQFAPGGEIEVEEVIEEEDEAIEEEEDPFPEPEANKEGEKPDHELVTLNLDGKDGDTSPDHDGKTEETTPMIKSDRENVV